MPSLERYYANGNLYARIEEEKREYFYENGQIKTVEFYKENRIDGEIILYWPNGKMKRKCHFDKGRRCGLDQMWNEEGTLVDEKDYGSI